MAVDAGQSQAVVPARGVVGASDIGSTRALAAGLDALEGQVPVQRSRRAAVVASKVLPPLVAAGLLLLVWHLAYVAGVKPPYALPSPADTWATLAETITDGRAWGAVTTSLSRAAVGFAASLVAGTALGLLMYASRWVRAAIGPVVSGLQSLPSVAWVPAAIIWFGLSDAAIYAVVLLGAVPSIANGLLSGLQQVPPLLDSVGRVLGLGAFSRVRFVLLPASLPGYLAGLKQGWAFAWRSLMAAELITYAPALGTGLGQLLNIGRELQKMDLVITSIGLILAVGIAIELLLFAPVERRVLRVRGLLRP